MHVEKIEKNEKKTFFAEIFPFSWQRGSWHGPPPPPGKIRLRF